MGSMSSLPYHKFVRNVDFLATRKDKSGFRRVWGMFVDAGNRMVVFWRHKKCGRFTFKLSETYQLDVTVSDKIDEKLGKGYHEIQGSEWERSEKLLRSIHHDFLDAKERGLFHQA